MGESHYHYTKGLHISQILAEQVIRVTPDFTRICPANFPGREEIERHPEAYGVQRSRTPMGACFTFNQAITYQDSTPATSILSWFVEEVPVVWLTVADFCCSALLLPRYWHERRSGFAVDDSMRLLGGFYRITVEGGVDVHPWHTYCRTCKVPVQFATAMGEAARRRGDNALDYWFTTAPITAARWTAVERYEDGTWKKVE